VIDVYVWTVKQAAHTDLRTEHLDSHLTEHVCVTYRVTPSSLHSQEVESHWGGDAFMAV
jgi:hypothetical protein